MSQWVKIRYGTGKCILENLKINHEQTSKKRCRTKICSFDSLYITNRGTIETICAGTSILLANGLKEIPNFIKYLIPGS